MRTAIIVAGGKGERLGRDGGKQLAHIAGEPVLSHTLRVFEACDPIDAIVVVTDPGRVAEYRSVAVDPVGSGKVVAVVPGGLSRSDSVRSGLSAAPDLTSVFVVHDGARPLVTPATIAGAIEMLERDDGCAGVVVGHPSYDTLKQVDDLDVVVATPDRATIWSAQTPQVFRAQTLRDAYERAAHTGWTGTDDASFVEHAGGRVRVFAGPRDNVKITVPEDLRVAEALLQAREGRAGMDSLRVGTGYDVHAFTDGRALVLGGVTIPYERGLAGHSDADVLVHALMDAIVGALREGDIGRLFPDTDPRYSGASSVGLLREVAALMRERGFRLVDADTVLVLEEPRIAPYRESMRMEIARALDVDVERVGVKATTTEGLGFAGRKEGVAVHAVALLERCRA